MGFLLNIDHWLLALINSTMSHAWLDQVVPVFTDLHKHPVARWLLPLFVVFLLFQHHRWKGFAIFFGLIVTIAFADSTGSQVFKKSIERDRPFKVAELNVEQRCPAGGYSFPSNHAINMFAFAVFASLFLPHWAWFFYLLAVAVCFTRVYCGVHFPADVFAGAAYGSAVAFLFSRFTRFLLGRISRRLA